MSYIDLKSQIISKLDLIDEIQQVEEYPTTDVNGYPAAIVRSMSNDAEYETTCDNLETYRFIVYLLVENSAGFKGIKKARAIVEEVADVIIDAFDDDEFLAGITLTSDRQMMGILPVTSSIDEVEEGKYVEAEISLNIRISKTLS